MNEGKRRRSFGPCVHVCQSEFRSPACKTDVSLRHFIRHGFAYRLFFPCDKTKMFPPVVYRLPTAPGKARYCVFTPRLLSEESTNDPKENGLFPPRFRSAFFFFFISRLSGAGISVFRARGSLPCISHCLRELFLRLQIRTVFTV